MLGVSPGHRRLPGGQTRVWHSTVFRRTVGVVFMLVVVAATVIAAVGWSANDVLTRATSGAIESELAALRTEFRLHGLDALIASVNDRSRVRGAGLYRLEDETGRYRAGNLDELPRTFSGGGRAGTFRYRPHGAAVDATRSAAGVVVDVDARAILVVARDIEEQRALLFSIYRSVGLGATLLALLGLVGVLALSRHILRRITAMELASASIIESNFSGRIPYDGSGDEMDRLAARLNEMLARIEQLMSGLREVSDNIAHDLRTPLSRLRNRAEAALGDKRGAAAWHDGLERVIDEADELIKTFNALLLIARLEAASTSEVFHPLDVAAAVRDMVELYEPVAEEAGFAIFCVAEGQQWVSANAPLLGQAIANLIDNALKYGKAGGSAAAASPSIAVEARSVAQSVVVSVSDRGPGIAPGDRERALRRFVRLEQSRSASGTGLGLSLVVAVARLHGGTVRLEDNAPGLRVVLTLPAAGGPKVQTIRTAADAAVGKAVVP